MAIPAENGRSERRATRPLWPPARRLGGRGRRLYSRDTHRLVRALGLAVAPIMESAQQSAAAGVTDGRGDGRSGRLPRGRIISGIRAQRPGISAVHGATCTLMVPNVNTNAGIFIPNAGFGIGPSAGPPFAPDILTRAKAGM